MNPFGGGAAGIFVLEAEGSVISSLMAKFCIKKLLPAKVFHMGDNVEQMRIKPNNKVLVTFGQLLTFL